MHMKDDHMRNAQLKPGYNVQIGVDSENILSEKGILYRMNRSIQGDYEEKSVNMILLW